MPKTKKWSQLETLFLVASDVSVFIECIKPDLGGDLSLLRKSLLNSSVNLSYKKCMVVVVTSGAGPKKMALLFDIPSTLKDRRKLSARIKATVKEAKRKKVKELYANYHLKHP